MDTDQLIRTLAADNAHQSRPVGFVLMLGLLAAAPVSLLMFFSELGIRPDVMTAMRNPFFDLKFAVTLALAISATAVSLHLSRPEASLRGFGWWLLVPAGLLVAGISGEMMQRSMRRTAPMIHRCSWRPGTRSRRHWWPRSARSWERRSSDTRPRARIAACGGSAAPAARSRAAGAHRYPCRPVCRSDRRRRSRRAD